MGSASLKVRCHGEPSSMPPVNSFSPVGRAHRLTGPLRDPALLVAPLLPHTCPGQLSTPRILPVPHHTGLLIESQQISEPVELAECTIQFLHFTAEETQFTEKRWWRKPLSATWAEEQRKPGYNKRGHEAEMPRKEQGSEAVRGIPRLPGFVCS